MAIPKTKLIELTIGTCSSSPDAVSSGKFHVADFQLSDGEIKPVEIPVFIVQGRAPGPTGVVISGMSGNDVLGMAACYSLSETIELEKLTGTLIVLPVLNTSGYYLYSDVHPYDGKSLKNAFPGSADGSVSEQIAQKVMDQVLVYADFVVNVAEEPKNLMSEVYTRISGTVDIVSENDISLQKAVSCGTEVILLERPAEGDFLVEVAQKYSVPAITVMSGGGGSADLGMQSEEIFSVLRNLLIDMGMYSGRRSAPERQFLLSQLGGYFASISGILKAEKRVGEYVKKGETVVTIISPDQGEKVVVTSDISGFVFQISNGRRVVKGDRVFSVMKGARVKNGRALDLKSDSVRVYGK